MPPENLDEANKSDPRDNVMKLPFRPLSLESFLVRKFPARKKLLSPWLPEKGLTMVFAPRGVGKTHFGAGVAYAVATGSSYLKWTAETPRKVLWIDGEMPAVVLQERLLEIVAKSDVEPQSEYLQLLPYDLCEAGPPDLATIEGQKELEPMIGDAELIIVDNISTVCRSGKENEAEGWNIVQAWALEQRRKGLSVLFVHHAGKGGDQRGTSKREDVMDTVIRLSRPDDYEETQGARFLVTFTKARGIFGHDVDPFEAQLSEGKWTCQDAEEIHLTEVRELLGEGKTIRTIATETGLSKSKVSRLKKKIEAAK